MIRKILLLLAPLAIVVLVETALFAGIWEPLAKPGSHAGVSVRLKRALSDPAVVKLDLVTLGSSRPKYGIDHALLAEHARKRGLVHADLSMPGSHWMTVGILTRWLARNHPEIRGGIVALSIQDLGFAGNGSYENGIVYPFRRLDDLAWMAEHVPFKRDDVESFGTWSALFGWRDDINDFVRSPRKRSRSLAKTPMPALFGNPESSGHMCAFGLESLAACDPVEAVEDDSADGLKRQCRQIRTETDQRPNFAALIQQSPLPQFMAHTRELVQGQLVATPWTQPPVVVLMPMPRIWRDSPAADGLHAWAKLVLQPLVAEGRIHLIDGTGFFDADPQAGCAAFFDFYHQNDAGRERFTQWLLPQLDNVLYGSTAGAPDAAD